MRVGIVSTAWAPVPPQQYGGIEAVVHELARGLDRAGHEVLLFTTGDSTCPVTRFHRFPTAAGERIGQVATELCHVMHAYEALAGAGVDVVHDHTIAGPLYAQTVPGLRVVTTVHGPLEGELADVYRRIAARVPTIAISHAQQNSCLEVPTRLVIHHGIDVDEFPEGAGNGGYCLFLGRMDPDKGAHRAILAAEQAGMPLVLAGKMRTQAECEYFQTEVEPRLGERAWYVGEVSVERKLDLLQRASCLLFPIRWPEPFGMVMIEAMACGTPVLAYPEGAAPEVVDDGLTGLLCADEQEMARAICQVPELTRSACRMAVARRFSATRMVHEHVNFYREVLSGAVSGSPDPRVGGLTGIGPVVAG